MRDWFVCLNARLLFITFFFPALSLYKRLLFRVKSKSFTIFVHCSTIQTTDEKCRLSERVELENDNIHCGVGERHSIEIIISILLCVRYTTFHIYNSYGISLS